MLIRYCRETNVSIYSFLLTFEKSHRRNKAAIIGGKMFIAFKMFDNFEIMSEKKYSIKPPRKEPITATSRAPQNLPRMRFLSIKMK